MNGYGEHNKKFGWLRTAVFSGKLRLVWVFVVIVTAVLWLAPQLAYSLATPGNGPGGVGTTNGSSTLELWLRADKGVFADSGCTTAPTNGNPAGCWQDQSGNSADATQGSSVKQPTFNTGSLNGQPVLSFNGGDVDALVSGQITLDDFTIFSVFNSSSDGFVYEQGADTATFDGHNLFSGTVCTSYVTRGGATVKSGLSLAPGWSISPNIVTHVYGGSPVVQTLSLNNTLQSPSDCFSSGTPIISTVTDNIFIGARNASGFALTGNLAELIFFSEDLPDVQKILVENYLSAKYNITLASNDYYDGDTPGNGDFDLDVAGIGQFGGVPHIEARAAGMVVVNGTFLNADGDWLLFGHNLPQNLNTTNDIPTSGDWDGTNDQRWARSFYFDRTDAGTAGGTVDLIFDFSDGGMTGNPAGTAANYRLLSRPNPSGQFSDITASCVTSGTAGVSIAGDQVTFDGVDVTCLGSNFTLGTIDLVNSPTAVSLQQPINITSQPSGLLVIAACVLTLGVGSLWVCLRHRPE